MTAQGWAVFATFWVVFVTSPGPNAVNCIDNGMRLGFARAWWGVAAILTQASVFLVGSAAGVGALIATSPALFDTLRLAGAAVLIGLGARGILAAGQPVTLRARAGSVFGKAFLIATINAKSLAGYIAAFSQFVEPDRPISAQMWYIMPTALGITALSYSGYTALGAWLGRLALGAVLNLWFRRVMGACFVAYGVALALM